MTDVNELSVVSLVVSVEKGQSLKNRAVIRNRGQKSFRGCRRPPDSRSSVPWSRPAYCTDAPRGVDRCAGHARDRMGGDGADRMSRRRRARAPWAVASADREVARANFPSTSG